MKKSFSEFEGGNRSIWKERFFFVSITHNFSPEGDKLKEISGLGKHDISYWRIDRLSTFVNLDGE